MPIGESSIQLTIRSSPFLRMSGSHQVPRPGEEDRHLQAPSGGATAGADHRLRAHGRQRHRHALQVGQLDS